MSTVTRERVGLVERFGRLLKEYTAIEESGDSDFGRVRDTIDRFVDRVDSEEAHLVLGLALEVVAGHGNGLILLGELENRLTVEAEA